MNQSSSLFFRLMVFVLMLSSSCSSFSQSTADDIARYREMIADGNPSELYEMAGEELWKKPTGPLNGTLEKCDLGLGPGVVDAAAAQLPKYFKDTNRVQDLESRLMTCIEKYHGVLTKDIVDAKFGVGPKKDMDALVAYVVTHSKGQKVKVSIAHPKEKAMYEMGKKAFYYQAGPFDFSCASCHGVGNRRIRLQDLPNLTTREGAIAGWGSWPAYRVSSGQFWTMQQRLNDCFRQQRLPFPIYGSEVTIALSMYMAFNANGGEIQTPGLKR